MGNIYQVLGSKFRWFNKKFCRVCYERDIVFAFREPPMHQWLGGNETWHTLYCHYGDGEIKSAVDLINLSSM